MSDSRSSSGDSNEFEDLLKLERSLWTPPPNSPYYNDLPSVDNNSPYCFDFELFNNNLESDREITNESSTVKAEDNDGIDVSEKVGNMDPTMQNHIVAPRQLQMNKPEATATRESSTAMFHNNEEGIVVPITEKFRNMDPIMKNHILAQRQLKMNKPVEVTIVDKGENSSLLKTNENPNPSVSRSPQPTEKTQRHTRLFHISNPSESGKALILPLPYHRFISSQASNGVENPVKRYIVEVMTPKPRKISNIVNEVPNPQPSNSSSPVNIQPVETVDTPAPRAFKCPECQKIFNQRAMLNRHRVIHVGGQYVCDICSVRFKHKGTLTAHQRAEHGMNRFGPK